jgi:hypothetical protein
VVEAFSHAITTAFAVAIPYLLVALLLMIFLPELPLRDTAHVGAAEPEAPIAPGPAGP